MDHTKSDKGKGPADEEKTFFEQWQEQERVRILGLTEKSTENKSDTSETINDETIFTLILNGRLDEIKKQNFSKDDIRKTVECLEQRKKYIYDMQLYHQQQYAKEYLNILEGLKYLEPQQKRYLREPDYYLSTQK